MGSIFRLFSFTLVFILPAIPRPTSAAESSASEFDRPPLVAEHGTYRWPGTALALSLGGSALLVGTGLLINDSNMETPWEFTLVGLGAVVGPALGHMYTGDWGKATAFSLGRSVFFGILTAGCLSRPPPTAGADGNLFDGLDSEVLRIIGLTGLLVLGTWEALDVVRSVGEFNERQIQTDLGFLPFLLPPASGADDGAGGFGLAITGRF